MLGKPAPGDHPLASETMSFAIGRGVFCFATKLFSSNTLTSKANLSRVQSDRGEDLHGFCAADIVLS